MGIRAGVASDRGLVRQVNEDSFFLREGLYAVCDGMGGARGGEVASQMACLGLLGVDPASAQPRELREAIEGANRAIVHRSAGEDHLMGMGTTMTAALLKGSTLTLAHVGDSRAYLFRDGDLDQLTEDHSWVGEMVRRGDLTPAQAAVHPHRSVITRALGTDGDVTPDVIQMEARVGDRILLCSDGLTGMVDDTDILEILAAEENAQTAAEMLVKAALEGGGEDNVTVVVIDVTLDEGDVEAGQSTGPSSSQILFGPSDRGIQVSASSHRRGAGVRERFGRRSAPPARPVAQRPMSHEGVSPDSPACGAAAATEAEETSVKLVAPPGAGDGDIDRDTAVATGGDAAPVATPEASEEPSGSGADAQPEAGVATAEPQAESAPEGSAKKRRFRPGQLRMFVILVLVVVALAVAVGGFGFYNSTIYYVGKVTDGTVALYRGLPRSVLGIELSSVVKLGAVKYDSLPSFEQREVDAHSLVSEEQGLMLLGTLGL